jgi:hypothetical protein
MKKYCESRPQVALTIDIEDDAKPYVNTVHGVTQFVSQRSQVLQSICLPRQLFGFR